MSDGNSVTIIGNLTKDPELRFTSNGTAVASFSLASNNRIFDRASNEWKDGESLFLRCSIWGKAAENASEALRRGQRVIATGTLKQNSYENREGEKRTSVELKVNDIGPSLRYTAAVTSGPSDNDYSPATSSDDGIPF